jgi:hypothetical protein
VLGAIAACRLAGCSSEIIDPEHVRRISQQRTALLKRQAPPSCEYRTASVNASTKHQAEPAPAASDASSEAAALQAKLDYERQCYKHAEMIARVRLTNLQAAVDKAMKRADVSEPR